MKGSLFLALMLAASGFAQTAETYRRDATEFARQKSWDQAIANYRKALEVEPNDALTHYDLALALKYKGEAKQAVDEFEAALAPQTEMGRCPIRIGRRLVRSSRPTCRRKGTAVCHRARPRERRGTSAAGAHLSGAEQSFVRQD